MRPRPEGRGERVLPFPPAEATGPLQCGHDPKAVENTSGNGNDCLDPAQASMRPRPEGRGERRTLTPVGRSISFNAATTRRPWRTTKVGKRHSPTGRSFNAATTRRPWRTQCVSWYHAMPFRGFNAATTRRPWRTPLRQGCSTWSRLLQCGHDPKAVGTLTKRSHLTGRLLLQCGHDPKAVENRGDSVGRSAFRAASMRPRPEGRGEPLARSAWVYCSRSFNAATTRRPWRTIDRSAFNGLHPRSFNAATTRRPWRTSVP